MFSWKPKRAVVLAMVPALAPAALRAGPAEVRLVAASRHATLEQAVERESALYLPPGRYVLERPLHLEGRDDVVILGSGRGVDGTVLELRAGSGIRLANCRRLLLGNLRIDARGLAPGWPALEISGERGSLALLHVLVEGGSHAEDQRGRGGIGLRLSGPAELLVQGSSFTGCGTAILIDHPRARLEVLGGNFQSNDVHIQQRSGGLSARGVGFQLAFGGADIELARAAATPLVVAGSRSEGPGHLLRVPETIESVDVGVKACSLPAGPFLRYAAAGTLALLANDASTGIEVSRGTVFSVGNRLGLAESEAAPYGIGDRVRALVLGDLRGTGSDSEPANALVGDAGSAGSQGSSVSVLNDARALQRRVRTQPVKSAPLPVIANAEALLPSVRGFGARGDGLTDDTAALQRAIDSQRGGPLFFPAGRYRVSRPLLLEHASGGWWVGAGMDLTAIVNNSGGGVVRTDGCGYATFQDLSFIASDGAATVFDLSWDAERKAVRDTGAALQANAFHRCRFTGGAVGLLIGREGFMGSESLLLGCQFLRAGMGLAVANFNALTNNVVGCLFKGNGVALAQSEAGSFNAYDTRFEDSAEADIVLKNSAGDAFHFENVVSDSRVLLKTTNSGAPIHVLFERLRRAPRSPAEWIDYAAGGSLVFFDSQLGSGSVSAGGGIAHKTLIFARCRPRSPERLRVSERARLFVLRD